MKHSKTRGKRWHIKRRAKIEAVRADRKGRRASNAPEAPVNFEVLEGGGR